MVIKSLSNEKIASLHEQLQDAEQHITRELGSCPSLSPNGKRIRFYVAGDRHGSKNGWLQAFVDARGVLVVHYGSWRKNISSSYFGDAGTKPMTLAERRALARQIEADKKKREAEKKAQQIATRQEVQALWNQAQKGNIEHEYLTNKRVEDYDDGLAKFKRQLLIPLRDYRGVLWNCQRIYPNGKKFYFRGGRISGLFHTIGKPEQATTLYICEGYATAATVHRLTSQPVITAFSTANLLPVSLVIKKQYPDTRIIIAGDDDRFSSGINAGRHYANKAAKAINCQVIFPTFPDGCDGSDFNDLAIWEADHA